MKNSLRNKFTNAFIRGLAALLLVTIFSCEKDDESDTLSIYPAKIEIPKEGGITNFRLETNADSWVIDNSVSEWLTLSSTSGTDNKAIITVTVNTKCLEPRSGTLTITAGSADPVEITVSQSFSDYLYTLTTSKTSFDFYNVGSSSEFTINTDAPAWSLNCDAEWLQFSPSTGGKGETKVTVTVNENTSNEIRTAVVTFTAENTPTAEISISQIGAIYPDYNVSPIDPDNTGMESTAVELAAKIKLGWNIGNTLEAIGGETNWGNPKITESYVQFVKQSGFNAIRLPCSWNQYMANSQTAQLKAEWLNRVKEVVQYCVNNDLYVLLNIHWDGGWLENNCTTDKQVENNAKQKAFWQQIATHLRDFDEHLLFAGANEPNVDNATQMTVLNSYHQTFVDAVRSTGGRNSYRILVVQGPSTDIEKTNQLMTSLPVDQVSDRLMVEIHYYTPWNFCGLGEDASWGRMFYYWGTGYHSTTDPTRNATWGEEDTVDAMMALMKTQFVDHGIPVVLGEYGPMRRSNLTGDDLTNHLASRAYYIKYVTRQAIANGILPFYWDTGGILNRNNNTVSDQQALDAIIEGGN